MADAPASVTSPAIAASAPRARHRRARSRRRWLGLLALAAPWLWIMAGELVRRPRHILRFDRLHAAGYAGGCALSLVVWMVLLYVAARRRGPFRAIVGALFVVLFGIAMGVEGGFYSFYNIYLSIDGQLHSKSIPWSIVGTLPYSRPLVALHLALAFAVALGSLALARRFVRPRRWPRLLAPLLVPGVLFALVRVPVSYRVIQSSPPDLIYFHGMTALVKERLGYTHDSPDLRVQKRSGESVPALVAKPARPRNVLLLLQESQRADVTCVDYDPHCDLATPHSNAVVPNRMPLLQMRANASTTAISISNIWSGVRPTESRDLLHSVPLMWDYARAAGYDTAYWTSQNLMFGNARLYVQDIPVSHRCVATELDSMADLDTGAHDELVADRAISLWGELKEPFFAVVHFSANHWPYIYDAKHAPFQPAELSKDADKNEEFKNYYKDVVYLSDMAVAKLLKHVRASDSGQRTVIVYTSDHGESFREHWQLGHTSSIYDEEILVPTWIDAPKGALTDSEEASIKAAKNDLVWHLDLAPTFLDLLGVWDDPALAPYRARMMGHPLTRPERTVEPVPITNCTWVWECSFRNWGLMQGPMKIEAREWDGEFHCFDLRDDPDEVHNLGEAACAPLPALARQIYHVMPNVTPPGRAVVDWGKH
jgi:glucan phosphoethanolaminetransferase (alkaline phosphatase superfamily)